MAATILNGNICVMKINNITLNSTQNIVLTSSKLFTIFVNSEYCSFRGEVRSGVIDFHYNKI